MSKLTASGRVVQETDPGEAPTFGQHAARLTAFGYDVIPITRATDRARWISSPGKQPAMEKGWQKGCPRECWPHFARYGLGILTRSTPAFDIDVLDPFLSGQIRSVMERELGRGPVRVGQAPKLLMPFRLRGEPFSKMAVRWRGLGDVNPDKPPAIEILADGQQFVALGIHPDTGRPYTWERDPDLDLPHGLLDPLDRKRAESFLMTAAAALERLGATEVRLSGGRVPPRPERPPEGHPRYTEGLQDEAERIAQALDEIGNPDLPYDDWIRIGHAIKHELSGSDGEVLWRGWSAKSAKDDPSLTARKWATFKPERIGAGTLFFLARNQ